MFAVGKLRDLCAGLASFFPKTDSLYGLDLFSDLLSSQTRLPEESEGEGLLLALPLLTSELVKCRCARLGYHLGPPVGIQSPQPPPPPPPLGWALGDEGGLGCLTL